MTSVFSVRRRAEEFNTLVEDTSMGSSSETRWTDALTLVTMMRDLPLVEPRPDFTASLREQLMSAADTALLPADDAQRLLLPPRRSTRDRRVAALVGGFAIVGASTSLAVAASTALPGEMLYPLKRAMENAETGLQLSNESKGTALLQNASDRLAEASELSRTGDLTEGAMVAETLMSFSSQATAASDLLLADYAETGDENTVADLRTFATSSMLALTELEAILPEDAQDELVYAAQVLGDIDAAAGRACPSCPGGLTQIPSVLMSAGEVAEPAVVMVPSPVVQQDTDGDGGKKDGGKPEGRGGGQQSGGIPDDDVANPLPDSPLSPETDTDAGGDTDPTGPLEVLTGPVSGQGGGGTTSSGGGLTGVPEVDDVIKDADDALPDLP